MAACIAPWQGQGPCWRCTPAARRLTVQLASASQVAHRTQIAMRVRTPLPSQAAVLTAPCIPYALLLPLQAGAVACCAPPRRACRPPPRDGG